MFLKLYIFGKIPPIKLELTICTKSWKGVQLLKRIHYSLVVNGCCCWVSVALLTREIQFSNFPIFLRILGVLSTFSFYPIYRFQREERRLEFNSGPLNFCHCKRKQALTVSKAISIAIDSNTSTRSYFCLYVVESSPLWAISFEKIGDRGLLARIVFARFPIGEQIFFPSFLLNLTFILSIAHAVNIFILFSTW